MNLKLIAFTLLYLCAQLSIAQVILNSNGPGDTYEEINAVLAPGYNVIEVPDCGHTEFGRHIDEVFDTELNTYVFRFIAHQTPDNDRCLNFDRQRTEIKTYDQSPENLQAVPEETVVYQWKFKLPSDFQVSPNFTHLHQIKSVGGAYASIPMITLTARKATPDRIELRQTPTTNQTTLLTANLNLFRGHWVDVTERITYGNSGRYSIIINRISDNTTILSYTNDDIDMWQDGATFARPKWGIYRSLINIDDLQDEVVLFNNFSIEEIDPLSISDLESQANEVLLIPNPSKDRVTLKNMESIDYDSILLCDSSGREIQRSNRLHNHTFEVSGLASGLYFITVLKSNRPITTLKCIIE
ncbi:T9SS type A sorting domain-containing protein [Winogradskyella psychrotolerans]|uniref:T9SS type A sorting domain-containing protein n=1 Tax=Winogradskyella psychrotolerans TaxID=1344585 RepID=UPI001C078B9A|nr:T9SS type A sorting domain-containing protein [Winogradskyella psychrotolerans]MBU2927960.1 heparin lyase I family protein [Winogradskyella psychrotolerans]